MPAAARSGRCGPYDGRGAGRTDRTRARRWSDERGADGDVDVERATGATTYDIGFGTTNPPMSAGAAGLTIASYTPVLAAGTAYYWRVMARNAGGSTLGPVWSFTTASPRRACRGLGTIHRNDGDVVARAHARCERRGGGLDDHGDAGSDADEWGRGRGWRGRGQHVQATLASGVSDIVMSVDYRGTGAHLGGLAFRQTDANNHLLLLVSGATLQLYRRQAGAFVLLTSQRSRAALAAGARTGWKCGRRGARRRVVGRRAGRDGHGWVPADGDAPRSGLECVVRRHDHLRRFRDSDVGECGGPPGTAERAVAGGRRDERGGECAADVERDGGKHLRCGHRYDESPDDGSVGADQCQLRAGARARGRRTYWQVVARNVGGTTLGPVWSFTTAVPPGMPTTPSPGAGATNVAPSASLTWGATGATSYDVAIGTTNPPTVVAAGLTSASYAPGLSAGTTYFWRVVGAECGRHHDGPGVVVHDGAGGAEHAVAGHVGAANVATSTSLTWITTGATSYDVAIGTTNPPAGGATGLTSPSYAPVLAAQTTLTSAAWRIGSARHIGSGAGGLRTGATTPANLIVADTFTGATGTTLVTHSPDVNAPGTAWTITGAQVVPTPDDGVVGIQNSAQQHLQATLASGASDFTMRVDYRSTGAQLGGLAFRLTDASNHLLLLVNGSTLQVPSAAGRRLHGAGHAGHRAGRRQRQHASPGSAGDGGSLQGWWDGVKVLEVMDTFQQTATRHGRTGTPRRTQRSRSMISRFSGDGTCDSEPVVPRP